MNRTIKLSDLSPAPGSRKNGKRKGRGASSGAGRSCCRGTGGSNKRSGYSKRAFFEGGQMPLARRLPKRGFSNAMFRKEYDIVNLRQLQDKFKSGDKVTPEKLSQAGLTGGKRPVKVLGSGELKKKLTVEGCAFSAAAAEKINSAGGSIAE